MIAKTPKSPLKQWIKRGALVVFVFEAVAFAGSYYVWHQTNTRRDFRKYLRQNYPSILEAFYVTDEYLNSNSNVRAVDQTLWERGK